MQRYPKIAVVILNWNGERFLSAFLPSVMATNYPNYALYVIDNGSTDNSIQLLKRDFGQVNLIQHTRNYGFTQGYNLGLRSIKADYYVLLNSDVAVSPDWLLGPAAMLENNPKIGAIQPKILAWDKPDTFEYAGAAGGWIDKFGYPFCRGRIMAHCEPDSGQYDSEGDVDTPENEIFWASGAALFVRADLYKALEGLDDNFFAHFEEIDLCWRIRRAGYTVHYCASSVVWHVGGGTLQKENPFKTYLNYRNSWSMLLKNIPLKHFFTLLPLRFCLDMLSLFVFLASRQWGNAKAVLRAHLHIWPKLAYHYKTRRMCKAKIDLINPNNAVLAQRGYYNGSIVWDYFVRKKRTFRQIITQKPSV